MFKILIALTFAMSASAFAGVDKMYLNPSVFKCLKYVDNHAACSERPHEYYTEDGESQHKHLIDCAVGFVVETVEGKLYQNFISEHSSEYEFPDTMYNTIINGGGLFSLPFFMVGLAISPITTPLNMIEARDLQKKYLSDITAQLQQLPKCDGFTSVPSEIIPSIRAD